MTCPSDLTIMMRADEELDASESVRIDEHVSHCERCRKLMLAMRAERQVLAVALHDAVADPRPATEAPAAGAARAPWSDAGSLGVVVFLVVALAAAVSVSQAPPFLGGLGPFHPTGLATWLFAVASFVIFEGVGALTSVARVVSPPAAAVGLLVVVLTVARAARRLAATGRWVVVFGMLEAPGEAFVVRQSDRIVVVRADETIDATLVTTGELIIVEGTVVGDVFATAADRLEIRGVVQGNVLAAGRYIEVDGEVGGSVFTSCEAVSVGGRVGGSLYALAQRVRVLEVGRIGGSVASYGQTATIEGTVERSVHAAGGHVQIAGTVQRNVSAAAERVTVGSNGRIAGSLTARLPEAGSLQVDPGAVLSGPPDVVRDNVAPWGRYLTASFYVREALWLLVAAAAGWLLFRISPGAAGIRFESPVSVLKALCVGILCVVTIPVAAVIGIALVGLPVAVAALGLLGLGLYLAKIAVALFLGRTFVGTSGSGGLFRALVVGLAAVLVAVNLPFVGWIINVTLTLIGTGVLFSSVADAFRAGGRRADSMTPRAR